MEETELGSLHSPEATGPRAPPTLKLGRGDVVGRYVIVEKLGAGGMGVVYSAYDPELDRRVALKLLNSRGGGSKASRGRARLIREAQALAKLNHTNVVTVHDVGEHEGRVFLAMEYIDGITLGGWIAKGPHPWHEVVEVLSEAGRGLTAAHDQDMTHRDFKPENVMLTGNGPARRVVVMDFGLATAPSIREDEAAIEASASSSLAASVDLNSLTRTGVAMGTPAYMAPEQHTGSIDHRADQFSFCVTLYEALYGTRPFPGRTLPELLAAAIYGELKPTPSPDPVPRWVRDAVVRGLKAEPSERWPSVAALIDALHDNPSRRRWMLAGAAGIALTAGAVYGVGWVQEQRLQTECKREASAVDEFWSTERREAASAAFAGSPLPYASDAWSRAEARLDEEVQTWSSLRRSSCLVRTSLPARLRDVQDACFEARRQRVDNAVGFLSEPDAGIIQRAVEIVYIDAAPCADETWLRTAPPVPKDPSDRLVQGQLRQDLGLGRALRRVGKFEAAKSHQEALVETATQAGELHLAAEARFELGLVLLRLGRLPEGVNVLEDAYFGAQQLSFLTLASKAARRLVSAHGKQLADPATGRVWARHAQILVDPRTQPIDQAHLDLERARLELADGEHASASELALKALGVLESEYGSYGEDASNAKEVLFAAYDRARNPKEALSIAREVLQGRIEAHGPRHPRTLDAHSNLAAVLIATRDFEEAETHARTSIDTGTAPDVTTSTRMENLSLVLSQTGRAEEALELNGTILELRRKHLPASHAQIGHALVNRSVMLFRLQRVDEIAPLVDEAIEIYLKQSGPQSPHLISTYRLRGAVLGTAGDHEAAIESFSAAADAQARVLGPKHPGTITVRVEVALTALAQEDYERTIELCEPWIEEAKQRDDLEADVLVPLHATYARAQLVGGTPALAKPSLEKVLELAPDNREYAAWGPVAEIDLGRLRWKTTPDKKAAINDVEEALARLKAMDGADPDEIKRAQTWLRQVKR